MPRVMPRASITRNTGRSSSFASAALLLLPSSARTVVQSLVALDQIHFRAVAREGGDDVVAFHQVQIEVATGAPGSLAEPHRIDVIGTFFERLDCVSAFSQRGAQAYADHRFSG